MTDNALKYLGRATMVVGVAVVAVAGWLKADDNSAAVFGLFLGGFVVCMAGRVVLSFGDPTDPWLGRGRDKESAAEEVRSDPDEQRQRLGA